MNKLFVLSVYLISLFSPTCIYSRHIYYSTVLSRVLLELGTDEFLDQSKGESEECYAQALEDLVAKSSLNDINVMRKLTEIETRLQERIERNSSYFGRYIDKKTLVCGLALCIIGFGATYALYRACRKLCVPNEDEFNRITADFEQQGMHVREVGYNITLVKDFFQRHDEQALQRLASLRNANKAIQKRYFVDFGVFPGLAIFFGAMGIKRSFNVENEEIYVPKYTKFLEITRCMIERCQSKPIAQEV